jgi:preprotein translocase subunit SecF
MEFFKHNSTIDFMGARRWTGIISLLFAICCIFSLFYFHLKWGLDFTGGTQIEVVYPQAANLKAIRTSLNKAGFSDAVVQSYGTSTDVLVSIAPRDDMQQSKLVQKIMRALPEAKLLRNEFIGPQVGKELTTKGILAVLVSMLATMIYIAIRFEYRFAISSAVALIHDPLLILGIFAFLQYDFDLKALAALLAVIGYSLNDTIVVFDRVRENFRKHRRATAVEIMNLSINQTLSRTIMTSALTLIVVTTLFIYGGEAIHGFALALMIGILVGTYSSIYVAGTIAILLGLNRQDLLPSQKTLLDNAP